MKGKNIYLRQLEEEDVNLLLLWENNTENWRYSETHAPYSMFEMKEYVRSASQVTINQQLRLVICLNDTSESIGAIDLFEIDFKNQRANVGILIANHENRGKGYATEALELIESLALNQLNLTHLYCEIQEANSPSIKLFENQGYIKQGVKKNWYKFKDGLIDVYFYQKFLK